MVAPTALALVLMLAGLIAPVAARAATVATLYVDQHNPNCSAAAAGTSDQPFCTIGAAAAKAAPGTTVVVASGTYQEQVRPTVSGTSYSSPVTFTAAPGATVVVTGGRPDRPPAPAFYLRHLESVNITGFTIKTGAIGVYVTGSDSINIAHNTITTGDKGVFVTGSSSVLVLWNHITGCAHEAIQFNHTGGSGAGDNVIDHNAVGVYVNGSWQIAVGGNSVGFNPVRGISIYGSGWVHVVDNVIHGSAQPIHSQYSGKVSIWRNAIFGSVPLPGQPGASAYAIDIYGGNTPASSPTGTEIANNSIAQYGPAAAVNVEGSSETTLVDNVIDVLAGDGGAAVRVTPNSIPWTFLDYDLVNAPAGKLIQWNSVSYASLAKFTAATGQESQGLQGPAGFADPAAGNLMLTPGSPAIDSGFTNLYLSTPSAYPTDCCGDDAWANLPVDDPSTANTGGGGRSYADRGAYEMLNLGFDANTAGWNTAGSSPGVTLARVAGGHTGTGAALLTNTGTSPATCTLTASTPPAFNIPNPGNFLLNMTTPGTYTATLWVRAETPGRTLTLTMREMPYNQTVVGQTSTTTTLTSDWQPVTVQYTAVGARQLQFTASVTGSPPGRCFYADAASIFAN